MFNVLGVEAFIFPISFQLHMPRIYYNFFRLFRIYCHGVSVDEHMAHAVLFLVFCHSFGRTTAFCLFIKILINVNDQDKECIDCILLYSHHPHFHTDQKSFYSFGTIIFTSNHSNKQTNECTHISKFIDSLLAHS